MTTTNTTNTTPDTIITPTDAHRAAQIGKPALLPFVQDALRHWEIQITNEQPRDVEALYPELRLADDGKLTRGAGALPMTYRVFGTILRKYTSPPRNVARVLAELPVAPKISPRAIAYNAYLARGRDEHKNETVVLRTRLRNGRRVIAGAVSTRHSRDAGDDKVFIAALQKFFKHGNAAHAHIYRGLEISEFRAFLPETTMIDGERWDAYLVIRNSETGAASWSVNVGLCKRMAEDAEQAAIALGFSGPTLTIEATGKRGHHAGTRVAGRIDEALEAAQGLLAELIERASDLGNRTAEHNAAWIAKVISAVVARIPGLEDGNQDDFAELIHDWAKAHKFPAVRAHEVIALLGQIQADLPYRAQTYPLEVLAGRVLMHGVDAAFETVKLPADTETAE